MGALYEGHEEQREGSKPPGMSGLFVKRYLGQNLINWLIGTGAGSNILTNEKYDRLQESQICFLFQIGTKELKLSVMVVEIMDEALLGTESMEDVDAKTDLGKQDIVINGPNRLFLPRPQTKLSVYGMSHNDNTAEL